MKKLFTIFILSCLIPSICFCQDYTIDYSFSNGYTLVYKAPPVTSGNQTAPEKTFGVIDDDKKIIVPIQYKQILVSGEPGVFIIKNKLDNAGLFSAVSQKQIVEPIYFEIESFSEGLAVVKKRKPDFGFSWGAVDINGQIVIPVQYDYLGPLSEGLMNFKQDNKMGFLDRTNKIIIPAMYNNYSAFSEGLAAVKTIPDGKYGYIDKSNKLVIAAQYEDANSFYGGFTSVAKKNGYTVNKVGEKAITVPGQWVVINKSGKIVQERTFDKVSPLNAGGLFIIESVGKKGTMNTAGMPILPMEYADVTIDKAGYTIYKTFDKKYGMMSNTGSTIVIPNYDFVSHTTANRFYVIKKGMYTVGDVNNNVFVQPDSANGVILGKKRIVYYYNNKVKIFDLNGNIQKTITDLNLKSYGHSLTETEDSIKLNHDATAQLINLAANKNTILPFGDAGDFNEEGIFIGKKSAYDFYDYTGKKLNAESYYAVVNFSGGIAALQLSSTSTPYLADKNFKKIKDLNINFIGPYSEGLAYANNTKNGMVYYLDKTGNEAFSLSAKEGSKCVGELISIKDSNSRFYIVNKKGKPINTKTWEQLGGFSEGLALIKDNGKWGFIDMAGNKIIDTKYDAASSFTKGAAMVNLGNKIFLINKKGEAIDGIQYDAAGNPGNGTFPVQKDKLVGLVDSKGNIVIDFKYTSILYMSEERVWASKDGKWGLLDNKGKALTEFIYQGAYDFESGFSRVVINDKTGIVNKLGKIVVPAAYKSLSSVYKNIVIAIAPSGTAIYPIK